jgi:hypothetical protein
MPKVPARLPRVPHEQVLFSIRGLMDKEDMEKLGFTDQTSWESEEQEKKYLFNKIKNLKDRARDSTCTFII